MTAFAKGPPLIVHILIATMINAFFFPLVVEWTGAILYGFFASVTFLGVYGLVVMLLVVRRRKKRGLPSAGESPDAH